MIVLSVIWSAVWFQFTNGQKIVKQILSRNQSLVFKFLLLSRTQRLFITVRKSSKFLHIRSCYQQTPDLFCLKNDNYLIIMIGCNSFSSHWLISQSLQLKLMAKQLELLRFKYLIMRYVFRSSVHPAVPFLWTRYLKNERWTDCYQSKSHCYLTKHLFLISSHVTFK